MITERNGGEGSARMEGRWSSAFSKVRTLFYRILSCEVLVEHFVLVLLYIKGRLREVRDEVLSVTRTNNIKQTYSQIDPHNHMSRSMSENKMSHRIIRHYVTSHINTLHFIVSHDIATRNILSHKLHHTISNNVRFHNIT